MAGVQDRYLQSHETAQKLIAVLKENKPLEQSGFDESLFHLLSAGLSQIIQLNETQAGVIGKLLPAAGTFTNEELEAVEGEMTQTKAVLNEISLSLLTTQKKTAGQDEISSNKDNIVEFYDYKSPDYTMTKVKDSELRPVQSFSGIPETGVSIDITMGSSHEKKTVKKGDIVH